MSLCVGHISAAPAKPVNMSLNLENTFILYWEYKEENISRIHFNMSYKLVDCNAYIGVLKKGISGLFVYIFYVNTFIFLCQCVYFLCHYVYNFMSMRLFFMSMRLFFYIITFIILYEYVYNFISIRLYFYGNTFIFSCEYVYFLM